MDELDLDASPLSGRSLVEASAGTGKTHAIAGLFLRLILEKGYSVGEILVVTYTEAATAELRARIRGKLRQMLEMPDRLERHDPSPARERLLEALRDFDEAAIFTIHGFCHRVLRESAFESGALFESELIVEEEEFLAEVAADYWRQNFYEASRPFAGYTLAQQ